jgi:hypothetical protein
MRNENALRCGARNRRRIAMNALLLFALEGATIPLPVVISNTCGGGLYEL